MLISDIDFKSIQYGAFLVDTFRLDTVSGNMEVVFFIGSVYQHGKGATSLAGFRIRISVNMSADHQVYACLFKYRDEESVDFGISVPAACRSRDMQYCDLDGSAAELFRTYGIP